METEFTELLSKPTAYRQWLDNEKLLRALLTYLFPSTTEKAHISLLPTPKTSDCKMQLRPKPRDFNWERIDE